MIILICVDDLMLFVQKVIDRVLHGVKINAYTRRCKLMNIKTRNWNLTVLICVVIGSLGYM